MIPLLLNSLLTIDASPIAQPTARPVAIDKGTMYNLIPPFKESYEPYWLLKLAQPQLFTPKGKCKPYPAVTANGTVSMGQMPMGKHDDGGCKTSPGQIYARQHIVHGNVGLFYSWYWPKEQEHYWSQGTSGLIGTWQSMVVWLYNETIPLPYVIKYTNRGKWLEDIAWAVSRDGHPVIAKHDYALFTDVNEDGEYQPLISWNNLPAPARFALNHHYWGYDATQKCLINDNNFYTAIKEAWKAPPPGLYS